MRKYLIIVLVSLISGSAIDAQQIDPALTSAVIAQTVLLDDAYEKRDSTQKKIIDAELKVSAAMLMVHNLEKKVLDYMQNASSAVENLFQIKKAAELVGDKIPKQLKLMANAVPSNYEGTAVTALTSKTTTDVISEMVSLYNFMSDLVTNKTYSIGNKKNNNSDKKNINLLSAAERHYIANEVVGRLQKIYRKLWLLTWQIENLGWQDGLRNVDPKLWAQMNNGKTIADGLIKQWNKARPFK